jgi:glycosyltransferase involved in cell wall biosynthesis
MDTAHWLFNNCAAYQRVLDVQRRRRVTLNSYKMFGNTWAIENADYATVLGNRFVLSTYRYAKKPLFSLPVPAAIEYSWMASKDFDSCRNHFLWFGSSGLVHKGLDLTLEAFIQMPDSHLTVCGPVREEPDFEKAYYRELYETPNIHTIGWVDIGGPEFLDIIQKCVGLVYPSCSEAQAGAVVTCLQAGLIPIVSFETGLDVEDFGILLKECTVDEIKNTVQELSALPAQELKARARSAWEFARANHTKERYSKAFENILDEIIARHSAKPGAYSEAVSVK